MFKACKNKFDSLLMTCPGETNLDLSFDPLASSGLVQL
jgi:hypothetical protein